MARRERRLVVGGREIAAPRPPTAFARGREDQRLATNQRKKEKIRLGGPLSSSAGEPRSRLKVGPEVEGVPKPWAAVNHQLLPPDPMNRKCFSSSFLSAFAWAREVGGNAFARVARSSTPLSSPALGQAFGPPLRSYPKTSAGWTAHPTNQRSFPSLARLIGW